MSLNSFYQEIDEELDRLKEQSNLRVLPNCGLRAGKELVIEQNNFLNLSSNDYLALNQNRELLNKFHQAILKDPFNSGSPGSTASRLLCGNHHLYQELEEKLNLLYTPFVQDRVALIFNSGYHGNLGILPALTEKGDLILSDKLNHASIIDGFRLSSADFLRYRHNDIEQLEEILTTKREKYRRVVIISESLFSMDGDIAKLKLLVDLKNKFNSVLYIDEAHSFGVFGQQGLGLCIQEDILSEVDILFATFGKALGGVGAFALVNKKLKELLVNKMRPLIFSTALPPINLQWLILALDEMISMDREREQLLINSQHLREAIRELGQKTLGESQIVPLITGESQKAISLAQKLKSKGIIALPVRPPTVPPNSSRIRFSLTTALNSSDIKQVIQTLRESL